MKLEEIENYLDEKPWEYNRQSEEFILMARTELPKLLAVAKAAKAIADKPGTLFHMTCDEKLHEGWNTVVVLEHYSTCRKCAFIKALNEFGLELEEPEVGGNE